MEDIRAIYRIFNNLKYEMENNGWVYQWHLGDEPIKVTHKFNPPVTPEEFQLFGLTCFCIGYTLGKDNHKPQK